MTSRADALLPAAWPWLPTPASRQSPDAQAAASEANTPPEAGTDTSNRPCSCLPSPLSTTPTHAPTTTGNAPREKAQRRHHLSGPTTRRRPPRHASQRQLLPTPNPGRGLTGTIGTPQGRNYAGCRVSNGPRRPETPFSGPNGAEPLPSYPPSRRRPGERTISGPPTGQEVSDLDWPWRAPLSKVAGRRPDEVALGRFRVAAGEAASEPLSRADRDQAAQAKAGSDKGRYHLGKPLVGAGFFPATRTRGSCASVGAWQTNRTTQSLGSPKRS